MLTHIFKNGYRLEVQKNNNFELLIKLQIIRINYFGHSKEWKYFCMIILYAHECVIWIKYILDKKRLWKTIHGVVLSSKTIKRIPAQYRYLSKKHSLCSFLSASVWNNILRVAGDKTLILLNHLSKKYFPKTFFLPHALHV